MKQQPSSGPGWRCLALSLLLLGVAILPGRAEDVIDWDRTSLLGSDFNLNGLTSSSPARRPNQIMLFRIVPGFLSEPVGLDSDDPTDPTLPPDKPDDTANAIQLSLGSDNPYFDLRRPGDPGGIGYYRLFSQVQVLDTPTTACTFGVRGATPAGRDGNGVNSGPTLVSPALGFFHALDDDLAFQAFIGKNMRLETRSQGSLYDGVEYGMALHRPILDGPARQGRVYMFVEALGTMHYADTYDRNWNLDVVPGLQWRMSENWWVSGGYLVPMASSSPGTGQWQITCSWQF